MTAIHPRNVHVTLVRDSLFIYGEMINQKTPRIRHGGMRDWSDIQGERELLASHRRVAYL